jgi:hypothetical protein
VAVAHGDILIESIKSISTRVVSALLSINIV